MAYQALLSMDPLGKNAGVAPHSLLQENLSNTETEPGSPSLQEDSLPSELPGKPCFPLYIGYYKILNSVPCAT